MVFCMAGVHAAAPSSVVINSSGRLSYIGTTYFTAKHTSGGTVAYCLDFHKETPNGVTMNLKGEADAGLTYIIQNGYPNKSFTRDSSKDTFITASAVWWYLDDTKGMSNLGPKFKSSASDPYGLRPQIQKLVNGAKKAKFVKPSLTASMGNKQMKLTSDKKYFESELATVNASGVSSYKVTLTNAPSGTVVVSGGGSVKNTFSPSEKFKVRVPVSSVKDLKANVSLTISASATNYKVYKYASSNTAYQDVVVTTQYPETSNVSTKMDLSIVRTKVAITKKDITNKKELPGAKLTVKDSAGKVIASWTSTDKPYYIENLDPGKYTLEEISAPSGYELNKEVVTFTVSADGKVQNVVMYNSPKKPTPTPTPTPKPTPTPTPTPTPEEVIEVPKTASSIPMALYFIGFVALAGGSGLIYYNAKLKK